MYSHERILVVIIIIKIVQSILFHRSRKHFKTITALLAVVSKQTKCKIWIGSLFIFCIVLNLTLENFFSFFNWLLIFVLTCIQFGRIIFSSYSVLVH